MNPSSLKQRLLYVCLAAASYVGWEFLIRNGFSRRDFFPEYMNLFRVCQIWFCFWFSKAVVQRSRTYSGFAFALLVIPFLAIGFKTFLDQRVPEAADWSSAATCLLLAITAVTAAWLALGRRFLFGCAEAWRDLQSAIEGHPRVVGYAAFSTGLWSGMAFGHPLKSTVSAYAAVPHQPDDALIMLFATSFPALLLAIPFGVLLAARSNRLIPPATIIGIVAAAALGFAVYAIWNSALWPLLADSTQGPMGWIAAGYFIIASSTCSELWRLMFSPSGQHSHAEGAVG